MVRAGRCGEGKTVLNPTIWLLVLAFAAAPVTAVVGGMRPHLAARAGTVMAGLAFGAALWGWLGDPAPVDVAWAPEWGLRFAFELDGLGALYSLLATGIGLTTLVYAGGYAPRHLAHQGRPAAEATRLYGLLLLFMGAMVGLVLAQDLILLFVFWDLTAVVSYLLIGYDRQEAESRSAALMAIVVTGVSAVLLLIGALMLGARYETFAIPEIVAAVGASEGDGYLTGTAALMAVAGLAKSAQVPFHFWLPRAMAAPTPVSAYLHSAAMVAAGVFLLGRLYPILEAGEGVRDGLLVVGLASMGIGGVLALTRDVMKQVLAYSTIGQYGYVVTMLGLGGEAGAAGAAFYVVAHAVAKSALFYTAGAVSEATGETRLAHLGGLRRDLPLLGVGSALAAASLGALPLTVGFFKDELLFHAALERGAVFAGLAAVGAALTVAYVWRFWAGIFLGPRRAATEWLPRSLVLPVVVLGVLGVLGGFVVWPVADLASEAASATILATVPVDPAYHLDPRAENLLALAAFALGAGIVVSRRWWERFALDLSRAGERFGPARGYASLLVGLNGLSDGVHRIEVRDLRARVASVLVPCALLVGAAVLAAPTFGEFRAGSVEWDDLPLILVLLVGCGAAVATAFAGDHLTMALVVSGVGYSLAVFYVFYGAPNVALVAVLIETIFTLLFLGMLVLLPPRVAEFAASRRVEGVRRGRRDPLIGVVAGLFAFVVAWGTLSRPSPAESVASAQIALTPDAHARDVVTAILADFRGLDTMGEATVIAVALIGIASLLRRGDLVALQSREAPQEGRPPVTTVMTQTVARLLFAPTLVVAAAIMVKGYADTGDGFSAGVIAALGVLLQYVAFGHAEVERRLPVHRALYLAIAGMGIALLTTFLPAVFGRPLLTHWPPAGDEALRIGSLELITAVVFDVGVFCIVFGFAVGAIDVIAHGQRAFRRAAV